CDVKSSEKVGKLGFNPRAIQKVLEILTDPNSDHGLVHGHTDNRTGLDIIYNKFHDNEVGPNERQHDVTIPHDWKTRALNQDLVSYLASINDTEKMITELKKTSIDVVLEVAEKIFTKLNKAKNQYLEIDNIDKQFLCIVEFFDQYVHDFAIEHGLNKEGENILFFNMMLYSFRDNKLYKAALRELIEAFERNDTIKKVKNILDTRAIEYFLIGISKGSSKIFQQYFVDTSAINYEIKENHTVNFLADYLLNNYNVRNKVQKEYEYEQKVEPYFETMSIIFILNKNLMQNRNRNIDENIKETIDIFSVSFWSANEYSEQTYSEYIDKIRLLLGFYEKLSARPAKGNLYGSNENDKRLNGILTKLPYNAAFTYMDVYESLFGKEEVKPKENRELNEMVKMLKSRDKEQALRFFSVYENHEFFINTLRHMKNTPEIDLIFKEDKGLSDWLFKVFLDCWNEENEALLPIFEKTRPDLERNKQGEAYLQSIELYMNDDSSFMTTGELKMFGLLCSVLELAALLPAKDIKERANRAAELVESEKSMDLYKALDPSDCGYIWKFLSKTFDHNITQTPLRNEIYAEKDKYLSLPFFVLPRDLEISRITRVEKIEQAERIYSNLVSNCDNFYRYNWDAGKRSLVGFTEKHCEWLLPLHKAYAQTLLKKVNDINILRNPDEAIENLFVLNNFLPESEGKQNIINNISKIYIDKLPDEYVVKLIDRLIEATIMTQEILEHIVDTKMGERNGYEYYRKVYTMKKNEIIKNGNIKTDALIITDTVIERMITGGQAEELFSLMISSRENDEALRSKFVEHWFKAVMLTEGAGQYSVVVNNDRIELIGTGKYDIITFDEFIERLYSLTPSKKSMILQKILTGKNGILNSDTGRQSFAGVLAKNIKGNNAVSSLITKIIFKMLKTTEKIGSDNNKNGYLFNSATIAFYFKNILLKTFLQRPRTASKLTNDDLGGVLWNKKNEFTLAINSSRDESSKPLNKLDKTAYVEFLDNYGNKQIPVTAVNNVRKVAEDLTGEIEYFYDVKNSDLQEDKNKRAQSMEAIDVVVETCQSLGALGVRFLQVLGQYLPLSDEYEARFRDIYDNAKGMNKFTAWDTLLKAVERYPKNSGLKKYVESIVSIDEKRGGGSIVTVFKVSIKDPVTGEIRKEVLKIKNPNAEGEVKEVAGKAIKIVEELRKDAKGKKEKEQYDIALRMLKDIVDWIGKDINDPDFMKIDAVYRAEHKNFTSSNGMMLRIPESMKPNNKDIKREEFVEGKTLNSILKNMTPGNTENKNILKRATETVVENFIRDLNVPCEIDGKKAYVIHSDIHFGNYMLSQKNEVSMIDRNYYLVLDQKDSDFVKSIIVPKKSGKFKMMDNFDKLNNFIDYFVSVQKEKRPVSKIERLKIAWSLKGRRSDLSLLVGLMQEMEKRGYDIPLKIRLIFKNLVSINSMLASAEAGKIEDYMSNTARQNRNENVGFYATALVESNNIRAPNTYNEDEWNNLSEDPEELLRLKAESALGRKINDIEFEAIKKAHDYAGDKLIARGTDGKYTSAYTPEEIREKAKILNKKITVIENGINTTKTIFTAEQRRKLMEYGVCGNLMGNMLALNDSEFERMMVSLAAELESGLKDGVIADDVDLTEWANKNIKDRGMKLSSEYQREEFKKGLTAIRENLIRKGSLSYRSLSAENSATDGRSVKISGFDVKTAPAIVQYEMMRQILKDNKFMDEIGVIADGVKGIYAVEAALGAASYKKDEAPVDILERFINKGTYRDSFEIEKLKEFEDMLKSLGTDLEGARRATKKLYDRMVFSGGNIYSENENAHIEELTRELFGAIGPGLDAASRKDIDATIKTVAYMHKDQRRKNNDPYVYHQLRVAVNAVKIFGVVDTVSLMIIILHDTREDQNEYYNMYREYYRNMMKTDESSMYKHEETMAFKLNAILLGVRILTKLEGDAKYENSKFKDKLIEELILTGEYTEKQLERPLLIEYMRRLADPKKNYKPAEKAEETYYTDEFVRRMQLGKLSDILDILRDMKTVFKIDPDFSINYFNKVVNFAIPIFIEKSSYLEKDDKNKFYKTMIEILEEHENDTRALDENLRNSMAAAKDLALSKMRVSNEKNTRMAVVSGADTGQDKNISNTVIIVLKGINSGKISDMQKDLNNGLFGNGFGADSPKRQREIVLINGDLPDYENELQQTVMRLTDPLMDKYQEMKNLVTVFAPSIVSEKIRDSFSGNKYEKVVGVLNDSYSDRGESGCIDIMARYMYARKIFTVQNLKNRLDKETNAKIKDALTVSYNAAFKGLIDYHKNITNDMTMDKYLDMADGKEEFFKFIFSKDFLLNIQPIDWGTITQWQESQKQVATSL
ncbi:MAG: hypothetical protein HQL29_05355, partial [Candidatus Omnitrophica bacterium]|nr:hypothetical protein [Candidatus Omnitrophota bacterium]